MDRITLPETSSKRTWNRPKPKGKGLSSKHPFSGAFAVSFRECNRSFSKLSSTNITVHSWILYVLVVNSRDTSPHPWHSKSSDPFCVFYSMPPDWTVPYLDVFNMYYFHLLKWEDVPFESIWLLWYFLPGQKQPPIGIELSLNHRFVAAYLPRPQARFDAKKGGRRGVKHYLDVPGI